MIRLYVRRELLVFVAAFLVVPDRVAADGDDVAGGATVAGRSLVAGTTGVARVAGTTRVPATGGLATLRPELVFGFVEVVDGLFAVLSS